MNNRYFLAGAILAAVIVAGVLLMQGKNRVKKYEPSQAIPSADWSEKSADSEAKNTLNAKSRGPVIAPVQIVEFSDFQCPACRGALPVISGILAAYPDQVRVTFKHFPLPGHTKAMMAHRAAECAAQAGKFWEFHDLLYNEQTIWSGTEDPTETLFRYAGGLGIDLDSFAACISQESTERQILTERAEGNSFKISSTPTFFVNGERLVGSVELKMKIGGIIQEKLKETS